MKADTRCDWCGKQIVLGEQWKRYWLDEETSRNVHERNCSREFKEAVKGWEEENRAEALRLYGF